MLLKEKRRLAKDKTNTLLYEMTFATLRFFEKRTPSKKVTEIIKDMKCFKCEKRYKDQNC